MTKTKNELAILCEYEPDKNKRAKLNSQEEDEETRFYRGFQEIKKYFKNTESLNSRQQILSKLNDQMAIIQKKINDKNRGTSFSRENAIFETNRAKFYRELKCSSQNTSLSAELTQDAYNFWNNMWKDLEESPQIPLETNDTRTTMKKNSSPPLKHSKQLSKN